MKKKTLSILLSGLLAVSLTGVGFASWVIVNNASDEETGSVAVETVEVNNVTINFAWADNDGSGNASDSDSILSFGYKGATNTGWLRNTDTDDTGCMELVFTLSASADSGTATASYEFEVVDNADDGYATATGDTKKYIESVGVTQVEDEEGQPVANTYKISISWGDAFDNKNPYDYYNDGTKNAASHGTEASTRLGDLKTLLTGVTFKLTLTGTLD